ncbi:Phage-related protein [Paraburkholderia fungorum]|uniref:Phage-related protein n=1 Tax=Paraburkholderia fungorum TaxID=134537 RepID=A0A1H1H180_9BURK|nr:phage tail protein [Paraburkholderia fungorum]SDR19180.1 Phage-related protein [Paraburkholderia fungorum]
MADTFAWVPTVANFTGTPTFKVRTAQFSDGYALRVADGLNNRSSVYSLQFIGDEDKMTAIIAFLDTQAGATSFYWTPPFRAQSLFTATYTEPTKDGDVYTMTATFTQTFAP